MLGLSGLKDSANMRVAIAQLAQGLTASRETELLKRLYMHVPPASIGLRTRPTDATFRDLSLLDGAPPVAWGVSEDTTNGALVAAGKRPGTVDVNGWAEAGYGGVVANKLLWLPAGRWNLLYSGKGNVGGAGAPAPRLFFKKPRAAKTAPMPMSRPLISASARRIRSAVSASRRKWRS